MLILSRKKDERVVISLNGRVICEVHVAEQPRANGRVRLGFKADPDVVIHRKEIYELLKTSPLPPPSARTAAAESAIPQSESNGADNGAA